MALDPSRLILDRYRYIPGETEVEDIDLNEVVIHNAVTGLRVTNADVEREAGELEQLYPGH